MAAGLSGDWILAAPNLPAVPNRIHRGRHIGYGGVHFHPRWLPMGRYARIDISPVPLDNCALRAAWISIPCRHGLDETICLK